MSNHLDRQSSGGFLFAKDDLGEFVTATIDLEVFEKAAVFKAAYWATNSAFLYFLPKEDAPKDNSLRIEIRPKVLGKVSAEQLGREFLNSLIDHQTRQIVLRETSGARDTLLHRAFGEGHRHLDPDTLT